MLSLGVTEIETSESQPRRDGTITPDHHNSHPSLTHSHPSLTRGSDHHVNEHPLGSDDSGSVYSVDEKIESSESQLRRDGAVTPDRHNSHQSLTHDSHHHVNEHTLGSDDSGSVYSVDEKIDRLVGVIEDGRHIFRRHHDLEAPQFDTNPQHHRQTRIMDNGAFTTHHLHPIPVNFRDSRSREMPTIQRGISEEDRSSPSSAKSLEAGALRSRDRQSLERGQDLPTTPYSERSRGIEFWQKLDNGSQYDGDYESTASSNTLHHIASQRGYLQFNKSLASQLPQPDQTLSEQDLCSLCLSTRNRQGFDPENGKPCEHDSARVESFAYALGRLEGRLLPRPASGDAISNGFFRALGFEGS